MKACRTLYIALSVCLLLGSCGSKQEQIPEGVMDTALLADFLTEAHLIESYNYVVVIRSQDSLNYQVGAAYDTLYQKYGITPTDYDSSLAWYMQHPQLLQETYERVASRLKELSDKESLLPPDPADSIEAPKRNHTVVLRRPKLPVGEQQ
ncbi:MAG: DUF4296 domain-containing protein [Bacteroidales bacterium]|nr:DUF4296 domain-containing protein [Bacteroidales bacterium]